MNLLLSFFSSFSIFPLGSAHLLSSFFLLSTYLSTWSFFSPPGATRKKKQQEEEEEWWHWWGGGSFRGRTKMLWRFFLQRIFFFFFRLLSARNCFVFMVAFHSAFITFLKWKFLGGGGIIFSLVEEVGGVLDDVLQGLFLYSGISSSKCNQPTADAIHLVKIFKKKGPQKKRKKNSIK